MLHDYSRHYNEMNRLMALLGERIPDTMQAFNKLHESSTRPGKLSAAVKELIALSIAITVRCDGCIAFHVCKALEAGASEEEITEAIGVAVLMGGGPSVVYGSQALEALEQFSVLEH